ncbi:unnamed protein product [Adineta steineri]|uniref:Uncharacterized protein n=1 Tax=Adineta steineri TaxID=433720 RepID=A0A818PIY2_9BILA|nr:unnamed protein product [Adineta steineri]CAF3619640.1 unnamed protein product [Adineta steineri]
MEEDENNINNKKTEPSRSSTTNIFNACLKRTTMCPNIVYDKTEKQNAELETPKSVENNTFEVIDANDRAVLQFEAKTSSNRVAAWRAKRNATESEASRLIRLDKESDARISQRRKRNQLTTITKDYSSSEDNADNKKNEPGNYEKKKLVKKPINKLDSQSRQINKLRKVRSLEEIGKEHQATLYHEVYEKLANGGLDSQRKNKDIVRKVRSLIESTENFKNNSNYEAFTMSIQQCNQNLTKI